MLGGTPRRAAVEQARQWFGPLGLQGLEARRPGQLSEVRHSGWPSPGLWWASQR
jgi:hypothetical protein